MVKTKVNWTSPSGEKFTFEYEVKKHYGVSSVKDVEGTIYHVVANNNSNDDDEKKPSAVQSSTDTTPQKKRHKGEEIVGYLSGYELRRGVNGNKMFYQHASCVGGELNRIASSLYDYKGEMCLAPRGSSIRDIYCFDGSMFLLEFIEIKHEFGGMDLGINFLHEYLSIPTVSKRVGLVVMYPWTINTSALRYQDNIKRMRENEEGKSENDKVDISRHDTVKLRQQFSRMGFQAIATTPDWVDSWFMSMQKYKSTEPTNIKAGWLSKEESHQLDVPMPDKKYVPSDVDKELMQVIESLKPDFDWYGDNGRTINEQREKVFEMVRVIAFNKLPLL